VQRFATGKPGDTATGSELWSALGRYGRVINTISADDSAPAGLFGRFGRDLPSAWEAHVEYNVGKLDAADPLLRMGVYSSQQQDRLRGTLTGLSEIPMRFGLSHGDLSIRNLLVSAGASPVLIDWGCGSFGPVPLTDLVVLDRDARNAGSPSDAEFHAFAEALGVDLQQVRGTLDDYRQLHLLDLVRWATDQRPDRLVDTIDDLVSAL
jgi:Phosphotransferase enzyme family